MVTWKGLNTETPQRGNVSKKRTHKTNLMSSSLIKKITIILPLIQGKLGCATGYEGGPSAAARMATRGPSAETRTKELECSIFKVRIVISWSIDSIGREFQARFPLSTNIISIIINKTNIFFEINFFTFFLILHFNRIHPLTFQLCIFGDLKYSLSQNFNFPNQKPFCCCSIKVHNDFINEFTQALE